MRWLTDAQITALSTDYYMGEPWENASKNQIVNLVSGRWEALPWLPGKEPLRAEPESETDFSRTLDNALMGAFAMHCAYLADKTNRPEDESISDFDTILSDMPVFTRNVLLGSYVQADGIQGEQASEPAAISFVDPATGISTGGARTGGGLNPAPPGGGGSYDDSAIRNRIASEEQARISGDTALRNRIATEESSRRRDTQSLAQRISAESSNRDAGDNTLDNKISSEANNRAAGDSALGVRISNEISERENADSALTTRVTALEAAQVSDTTIYKGVWSPDETYQIGDMVRLSDRFFIAEFRNTNSRPTSANANWGQLDNIFHGNWASNFAYHEGDIVTVGNDVYFAIADGTNRAPATNPRYWVQINGGGTGLTPEQTAKLEGIEAGAEVNIQSDWDQSDSTQADFIKNKPLLPNSYAPADAEANVQPDWDQTDSTADDFIKNKPGTVGGGQGLQRVTTDDTLSGDGTSGSPLSVVKASSDDPTDTWADAFTMLRQTDGAASRTLPESNSGADQEIVVRFDASAVQDEAEMGITRATGRTAFGNLHTNVDTELRVGGKIKVFQTNVPVGQISLIHREYDAANNVLASVVIAEHNTSATTPKRVFDLPITNTPLTAREGRTYDVFLRFVTTQPVGQNSSFGVEAGADAANVLSYLRWKPDADEKGIAAVASDTTITGDGTEASPLGVAVPLTVDERSKLRQAPTQFAPINAEENVQSDWDQTNVAAKDYIKNKPVIPAQGAAGSFPEVTVLPAPTRLRQNAWLTQFDHHYNLPPDLYTTVRNPVTERNATDMVIAQDPLNASIQGMLLNPANTFGHIADARMFGGLTWSTGAAKFVNAYLNAARLGNRTTVYLSFSSDEFSAELPGRYKFNRGTTTGNFTKDGITYRPWAIDNITHNLSSDILIERLIQLQDESGSNKLRVRVWNSNSLDTPFNFIDEFIWEGFISQDHLEQILPTNDRSRRKLDGSRILKDWMNLEPYADDAAAIADGVLDRDYQMFATRNGRNDPEIKYSTPAIPGVNAKKGATNRRNRIKVHLLPMANGAGYYWTQNVRSRLVAFDNVQDISHIDPQARVGYISFYNAQGNANPYIQWGWDPADTTQRQIAVAIGNRINNLDAPISDLDIEGLLLTSVPAARFANKDYNSYRYTLNDALARRLGVGGWLFENDTVELDFSGSTLGHDPLNFNPDTAEFTAGIGYAPGVNPVNAKILTFRTSPFVGPNLLTTPFQFTHNRETLPFNLEQGKMYSFVISTAASQFSYGNTNVLPPFVTPAVGEGLQLFSENNEEFGIEITSTGSTVVRSGTSSRRQIIAIREIG